MSDQEQRIFD